MGNLLLKVSGAMLFIWIVLVSGNTPVRTLGCEQIDCGYYSNVCFEYGGEFRTEDCQPWTDPSTGLSCTYCGWVCNYDPDLAYGGCYDV